VNACPLVCHIPQPKERPNYYNQKNQLPGIKDKDFQYKTAHKLVRSGKKFFFHEELNLKGLTKRNTPKQDEQGNYLPNGQSAKSGLNKSWLDAAFGQFFSILGHIAGKAGTLVVAKNPAYTSQLLSYRDEFVFTDRSIRKHWDKELKIWVDRDINAAINLKRVGLDVFPTIVRFVQPKPEKEDGWLQQSNPIGLSSHFIPLLMTT
jgi:putative transposase